MQTTRHTLAASCDKLERKLAYLSVDVRAITDRGQRFHSRFKCDKKRGGEQDHEVRKSCHGGSYDSEDFSRHGFGINVDLTLYVDFLGAFSSSVS